jgi:hypothetical protein
MRQGQSVSVFRGGKCCAEKRWSAGVRGTLATREKEMVEGECRKKGQDSFMYSK